VRAEPAEPTAVIGRLVLHDRVVAGRIGVADGRITSVEEGAPDRGPQGPYVAPGFIDLHVHGWGGHDAMGSARELDGMARALLRHGVTSFLPTAVTASLPTLATFASTVAGWMPAAPHDGAEPLGSNLEGPFLADARRGVHNPAWIRDPADVAMGDLEGLIDGLRLTTVAPERPGAIELIGWLTGRGVRVSLGHSSATIVEAVAGYRAGAVSTTHLFNAMTGIDHHAPGLAVAALTSDDIYVELIADGHHVDRAVWPIISRTKPAGRLLLVSDAVALAGTGDGRTTMGGLEIEVRGDRATMVGGGALAGSVIALDRAVQNLVASGVSLSNAVVAASTNPAALLGMPDRGRIAVGQLADLVELDDALTVRRVMRRGRWYPAI
jgi:N-acetylglucosamine-6-phosphate deacetylase